MLAIKGSDVVAPPQVIQDKRIEADAAISVWPNQSIAASDGRVVSSKYGSIVCGSHCGTSLDQLNRAVLLDLEESKAQLRILNDRIQRRIEAENERNSEEALEDELRQRELEIERERKRIRRKRETRHELESLREQKRASEVRLERLKNQRSILDGDSINDRVSLSLERVDLTERLLADICQKKSEWRSHVSNSSRSQTKHSDDSSLKRSQTSVKESSSAIEKLLELQLVNSVEMKTFNGESKGFLDFWRTFQLNVESRTSDNSVRLNKLISACGPAVEPIVSSCLRMDSEQGYAQAKSILWQLFGHTDRIVASVLDDLKFRRTYSINDSTGLILFSFEVSNALKTLEYLSENDPLKINYVSEGDHEVTEIMTKMPESWEKKLIASKRGRRVRLEDLSSFLIEETKHLFNPQAERCREIRGNSRNKRESSKKRAVFLTSESSTVELERTLSGLDPKAYVTPMNPLKEKCFCCGSESHRIFECRGFIAKGPRKRLRILKRNGRCFNCLGPHMASTCELAKLCELECGLKLKHHTLLHDSFCSQGQDDSSSESEQEVEEAEAETVSNYATSGTRHDLFLNIVPIRVVNPETGDGLTCFGMLDECADKDIGSDELVARLKLKTKGKMNFISTVTGTVERESQHAGLLVENVERGCTPATFALDDVTILPCSNFAHLRVPSRIDKERYPHLVPLTTLENVDVPRVLVLISVKHAELHDPIECIIPTEGKGPRLMKTKLGFVIRGIAANLDQS